MYPNEMNEVAFEDVRYLNIFYKQFLAMAEKIDVELNNLGLSIDKQRLVSWIHSNTSLTEIQMVDFELMTISDAHYAFERWFEYVNLYANHLVYSVELTLIKLEPFLSVEGDEYDSLKLMINLLDSFWKKCVDSL